MFDFNIEKKNTRRSMKKLMFAFAQAIDSIRSNFFHTFLSILGIVIGVAALVAILSLIDGMEKYAQEQISSTTDLQNIKVETQTHKTVNNIRLAKDTFAILNFEKFTTLQASVAQMAEAYIAFLQPSEVYFDGSEKSFGAMLTGVAPTIPNLPGMPSITLEHGRLFDNSEVQNRSKVAIINNRLAQDMAGDEKLTDLLGKTIRLKNETFEIIGILEKNVVPQGQIFVPFTLISEALFSDNPPSAYFVAHDVLDIPNIKNKLETTLKTEFPKLHEDFQILTNEFRVDQAAQGFMVFRLIMGMIVGISVLVGGIGVMNVLLISVTERTPEIGLRKALGANKSDIMQLFLSESITISFLGSLLGVIFGILGTMIIIPIIKMITKVPFQAAYTLNTMLIITIIAILIGIIFGTYPAMKAARLDPVEAIRRE